MILQIIALHKGKIIHLLFIILVIGVIENRIYAKDEFLKELSSLETGIKTNEVTLRVLDKITARVSDIMAPLNKVIKVGPLEITARFCQKSLPEDPPESVAFLDIVENKKGEKARSVFSGWMFSSSPGISTMEHPVYDMWVLHCSGAGLAWSHSSDFFSPEKPENSDLSENSESLKVLKHHLEFSHAP